MTCDNSQKVHCTTGCVTCDRAPLAVDTVRLTSTRIFTFTEDDTPRNFDKDCKLTTFMKAKMTRIKFPLTCLKFDYFCGVQGRHRSMTDDGGTTAHAMFGTFIRCMAILYWSHQNIIDILTPVLLEREKQLQKSVVRAC